MTDEPREVVIARLGAQADGIAATPGGDVFVPYALPGERWRLDPGGTPSVRLSDSPDRRDPLCRHFGSCGGCSAQHMSEATYRAWKHAIVVQAFAHRGLEPEIAPLECVPLHSRRRAVLGVKRVSDGVLIGFREGGQHRLIDMAECPVLDARIVAALDGLRRLAAQALFPGDGGRLAITATEAGLDVSLSTGKIKLTPALRARLAAEAEAVGLARLEVEGEVIAVRARPRLTIGGVPVEPPNGIFLQAAAEAETRLQTLALAGIGKAKRVADLFCGLGTFTFPLARKAEVLAVDGDKAALATLTEAQRRAQGLKRIEVKRRDLFREPLSTQELAGFDAVVMDPPRAGASAQSETLARSKVRRIVMVSCNSATLARDCRTLIDAGFKLGPVTPVDQFLFTPHVEVVAILSRSD